MNVTDKIGGFYKIEYPDKRVGWVNQTDISPMFNNSEKIEHDSSFEFSFPIGKNSYSVEAYIIDRKNKFSNRIDWITNAAFFNVTYPLPYSKTNFKGGIADFNAKKESSWKLIESN